MKKVFILFIALAFKNLLSSQPDISAFGSPLPPPNSPVPPLKISSTFGIHSPIPTHRVTSFGANSSNTAEQQQAPTMHLETAQTAAQHKKKHEEAQVVNKLALIGRPFKPQSPHCDFAVPVTYNEKDTQTVKAHNGLISLALWNAIQKYTSTMDTVPCTSAACKTAYDKKLKAENVVVALQNLHPKWVVRKVRYTAEKSPFAVTIKVRYDEHDTELVPVDIATYVIGNRSYSVKAIPKNLWEILIKTCPFCKDKNAFNSQNFNLDVRSDQ